MTNTYIQDKLDAIENDLKEKGYTKFERETIIDITKQSLTDYHNHIVEKMDKAIKSHEVVDSYAEGILEGMMHCKHLILQDTNQKEYESK